MKEGDRASVTKECGDAAIAKAHDNFCKMTKRSSATPTSAARSKSEMAGKGTRHFSLNGAW
ncbi:hypothetical protein ACFSQQ_07090 [Mesorhizobium kowhaii]|jgi:hypothetical protein|uniref:hypothetical protein n=1 Tax=Mesorhizobium kowhaii TaxID=1300272 RepID=UPI001ABF650A|nr:hypothetical protein [Mesorhizobium kowhaii]